MSVNSMTVAPGQFDLYRWLPSEVQAAFAAAAKRRRYTAGRMIYSQSDFGDEMFRLIEGEVRLSVTRGDGRELVYLLFKPGYCFGESSLIDGGSRPHTAEAQTDAMLDSIPRDQFNRLRTAHPVFESALLRLLCGHMRLLSEYVADASLDQLSSRLASRLLATAREVGDGALTVRLSQAELGRMIGASRQTVNKLLQQLRGDGLVALSHGAVTILDQPGLQRLTVSG